MRRILGIGVLVLLTPCKPPPMRMKARRSARSCPRCSVRLPVRRPAIKWCLSTVPRPAGLRRACTLPAPVWPRHRRQDEHRGHLRGSAAVDGGPGRLVGGVCLRGSGHLLGCAPVCPEPVVRLRGVSQLHARRRPGCGVHDRPAARGLPSAAAAPAQTPTLSGLG